MKINREINIEITTDEVSDFFAHAYDYEQAKILNKMADEMFTWEPHARLMQCLFISKHLNNNAKDILKEIIVDGEQER